MPSPPCTLCVPEYIQELDKFPSLRQNGFSFLVDASSKLFTSVRPSLKDVETNIEAGRFCAPACLHVSLHSFILILSSWPLEAVEGIMRATRGRGREGSAPTCSRSSSSSTTKSTSCCPRAWLAAWTVCRLGPLKWAWRFKG